MKRVPQVILIVATLVGSWLGMQAVHELGHVVGAVTTGGRIAGVVLDPLTLSRTELAENPHPLIVVWAGPLGGATLPLFLWALTQRRHVRGAFVVRFFAAFCLVANGVYIAGGSFAGIGDCGEMLHHGSATWPMWLFGAITVPLGFRLWHGQGTDFGLGIASGRVDNLVAYAMLLVSVALVVTELIYTAAWRAG